MSENAILSALEFDETRGALRYKGVRYLLIRPETLAELQSGMNAQLGAESTGAVLYQGGFAGGQLSGQKFKHEFDLSDREAVEFMCRMGCEIGWGHFKLIELTQDGHRLVVQVDDSPFVEALEDESPRPVCHVTRGVLGGLLSGLSGLPVRAAETTCLGMGDPACRFEVEVQV